MWGGAGAGASPSEVGVSSAAAFRRSRAAAAFGRVIFVRAHFLFIAAPPRRRAGIAALRSQRLQRLWQLGGSARRFFGCSSLRAARYERLLTRTAGGRVFTPKIALELSNISRSLVS